MPTAFRPRRVLFGGLILLAIGAWVSLPGQAQPLPDGATLVKGANFKQAYKYSPDFLRQFVYSTSVTPNWIGKTDAFWYQYNTSAGKQWYRVNPHAPSKEPLFDRIKLGAQLSELVRKPLDARQLPLTRVTPNDDGAKLKFVTEELQFEYDLKGEKLVKIGKAPPEPKGPAGMSPAQLQRMKEVLGEERYKDWLEKQRFLDKKDDKDGGGASLEEQFADLDMYVQDALAALGEPFPLIPDPSPATGEGDDDGAQQKKGFGFKGGFKGGEPRVFSPDKKLLAYALNHNLYLAEADKEADALQLSKDGGEQYTFNGFGAFGGLGNQNQSDEEKEKLKEKNKDKKTRPNLTWSKDSRAFYCTRGDSRGVKDLFLVNAVETPRPSLRKYPYAMPGDDAVRKTELYVCITAKKTLVRVQPKWKDEYYSDTHWGKSSDELRFVRHDRLNRNAELCTLNTQTGECKCVILEGFENSSIATQPIRYLDESDEMLWWSERSNWGHFYLYDRAGKLKNAITSGDFRAGSIVAVDGKNRLLFFKGNGREPGENVYHNHLYCVHLDGSGMTLMNPGPGNHDAHLSPSHQFVVDNCSQFDAAPVAVLRDAHGQKIMDLEQTDVSKLREVGWKMPETFIVKAADGVTDLYGQMWKPFDFDARKKYPIIANVYPGPQTESMTHAFQAITPQQQLAQLNFIVIQVGNRGGSPLRSKAYQAHSYWNMRDYGLADKKAAIEQLAARCPFIDIDRVGIYGHSGGGFMSAAAMLVKPYNDFFKVAVASAGNHDNNVYNNGWAERYHGMKELPGLKEEAAKEDTKKEFKGGFRKKGGEGPPDDEPAQDDATIKGDKKDDKKIKGKDDKNGGTVGKGKDDKQIDKAIKGKDDKKDGTAVKGHDDKKDDAGVKAKDEKKDEKSVTHFAIKVPTNPDLAANLKGKLLLVHGDMDNNVHPANTIRLADALIKANKRFDLLILPGKAHAFTDYQPYFTQRMWEYFAEHLLDDRPSSADMFDRREKGR
jgi:dipeptidyl aminopeptidase/acylaminoacyl peptidase